ncbi:MAG: hypothetical protein R2706_11105 [Acidimicrobiales bacterium]
MSTTCQPRSSTLAFNLSAELTYTNVLNCIDLAGLAVRSADRQTNDPFVLAGGHCTYNPEPIADFVDAVVLGDGEEVVTEITDALAGWKSHPDRNRGELHRRLAGIDGVYVPCLYEPVYDGPRLVATRPIDDTIPEVVENGQLPTWATGRTRKSSSSRSPKWCTTGSMSRCFGLHPGCRFCQAGMITRPVRERLAEQVRAMVRNGSSERATTRSRSPHFRRPTSATSRAWSTASSTTPSSTIEAPVSVALPSLRVDAFGVGIAAQLQRARRTGLTFAPEAGTWRMRQIINKLIREEDLYEAVDAAYSQGWQRVKLYFLTGLPSETDDDTLGIAELASNCVEIGKKYNKRASATASIGGFVPKPFTPFQWFGQTPRSNSNARSTSFAKSRGRPRESSSSGTTLGHLVEAHHEPR